MTRVHTVFPLAVGDMPRKASSGLRTAVILVIRSAADGADLEFFRRSGRLKVVDVFSVHTPVENAGNRMPPECAPGLLQPDYRVSEDRGGVTDHSRWALSIVMRAAWAAGRPLEEGPLDGGEGRGGSR